MEIHKIRVEYGITWPDNPGEPINYHEDISRATHVVHMDNSLNGSCYMVTRTIHESDWKKP